MLITLFNNLTSKEKEESIKQLIDSSSPRQDFFFMVGLSILMATFGLLLNNMAVIIGSMLIAPMLYPLLSLALGIVISDLKLIWRSLVTIGKSTAIGVVLAALVTLLFADQDFVLNTEIIERTNVSLGYTAVAVIAGLAASYAFIKPQLNERLVGVAISVALIPPLAVMGIGLARFDGVIVRESLLLFLINVIGITLASMIVFSMMNLYVKKEVVKEAVNEDEKEIKKEIARAEKEIQEHKV